MLKERITASELARMIPEKIGAAGMEVVVRKHHACAWQPSVVSAPADLIGYQDAPKKLLTGVASDSI